MNTNTDFDKIDKVLSKNGGGLFSTCWCVGLAIRRTRLGLEEDREGLTGCYPDKYYVKNYLGNVL